MLDLFSVVFLLDKLNNENRIFQWCYAVAIANIRPTTLANKKNFFLSTYKKSNSIILVIWI